MKGDVQLDVWAEARDSDDKGKKMIYLTVDAVF
jgi:hypothetical protein